MVPVLTGHSSRADPGAISLGVASVPALERVAEALLAAGADACAILDREDGGRHRIRAARAADPALATLVAGLVGQERALAAVFDALRPELRRSVITVELRSGGRAWGVAVLAAGATPSPAGRQRAQVVADLAADGLEQAHRCAEAERAGARFAAAFEHAPSGMALVRVDLDRLGIVCDANAALAAIVGREPAALVGMQIADLYHPDDRAVAIESAAWLLSGELEHYGGERRFQHSDGRLLWVHVQAARLATGASSQVILQVQDVTDRRRRERELQHLADHDPLTGLFNRRRFAEELEWVLAYSRRYGTPAAVVLVDLDNFKFVNDTFGHATGDELLATVGEVLRSRCRETDIGARIGGDEFGIILPQCGRDEAGLVAKSLLEAVRDQVRVAVGPRVVQVTASVGVRLVGPDTTITAEEVLSDADIALYDAKEVGRDRMSVAADDVGVTDRLRARMGWSDRIRDALVRDEFELFEQPIVALGTGRTEGSEILLRMRAPDGTLIAPGRFLDVAERFGQIQAIDCWVIARAVRLLAARQADGIDLDLEVNLSGGSVSDATVIDFIAAEVRNAPIDPTRLTFEITETAAIVNIDRARSLAQGLADLGCRFALDDFGSGFGSFYYLKHLPFDVVKIDGEFVKELVTVHADRLTVQAIVQIAKGLGKTTIAEQVEDEPTLVLLRALEVDFAQGFHLGRPRAVRLDPGFVTR